MDTTNKVQIVSEMGYPPESAGEWYEKYLRHLRAARARNLISELTFPQYLQKARTADLESVDSIGRCRGEFQLGRVGDVGNYTQDTCRFIPTEVNHRERVENGRCIEGMARKSLEWTGQTKDTSDRVRRMSETKIGRTKETHSGHASQAVKISKNFQLKSPYGVLHTGSNLSEFCDANNLNKFAMYDVIAGRRKHHKGWTGQYL